MYQTPLSTNFNAMNAQYTESFVQGPNRTGLIRSASTSCAVVNNADQPRPPPRRRKRGESLGSDQLGSANSSQYSLVNYPYNEMDPNTRNTNTIKQTSAWTPNSTLRRYMSSDMAPTYNRHFNAIGNQLLNNYNEQMQKPVGVLDQVINRSMPTPPPRLSSAKNTLRRRSYVENLVSPFEPPVKPIRQKLQSGLNQSQFDIPGTPVTTHLPPQSLNRFVATPTRPSTTLSSINLSQTANLVQQPIGTLNRPSLNNPVLTALQTSKSHLNRSNTNLDFQQPFHSKTMSLDNLHAAALKQNLRRSPTREELFDYIVAQQEQLAELKTQQKVLEKQVDIAHKEASKAHHHHHHNHRRHRHHKNRSKERTDANLDNSIDSSSMISSERRSKSHHHRSKVDKNLTAEANRQVHDHIKQLQEQLELIRQKRRKIKSDKGEEPIDRALDKSIDQSLMDDLKEKTLVKNGRDKENQLLRPPVKQSTRDAQTGKEDDLHNNRLSPIPTPMSSNRSPLNSRSSSIERAITKRELLRESAKEKWNRSFMEDLADDQLIKELSKSPANQDILKELLPKISINTDDKNRELNYNEILEKNLKLNPAQNWLTDPLDEYTYSERSPIEPLSPFGGRRGVFRPISADGNVLSPSEDRRDLLTGESGFSFSNLPINSARGVDRKETSSPIPRNYFDEDNIEGYISKKANNLITGDIDLLGNRKGSNQMGNQMSSQMGNQMSNQMGNQVSNQQAMNQTSGNSMANDLMANSSMANNQMANNQMANNATTSDKMTNTRHGMTSAEEQQYNLLRKQEEQLIERLESELMNEKTKQKELMDKKNEIERRQIEHDIELEKTKRHLLEQQNLFQEQQQLLMNQRQEIEIERWRMEQEKNQLKHEHEMSLKRDQFEQQKVLNQQLEQQRRAFDQQLQSQKALQEQLQKELEHQRQLQIKNQQQSANAMLNTVMSNAAMSSAQQPFGSNLPAQSANFFNDPQQLLAGQRNLQSPTSMHHPPPSQTAANQQQKMQSLNAKKSPLTSPLQSLQSLLPHALQPKSLQNQLAQQSQQQLQNQLHQSQLQNQLHQQQHAQLQSQLQQQSQQLQQQSQQLQNQLQQQQSQLQSQLQNQMAQQQSQLHSQMQQQSQQLQNQLQQQSQFPNQNEPAKPRRHRLGQEEHPHQYSAFKPPMHSNSKLNLIDSPKSSFNAINQITTPFISTEQRPSSPRPQFAANPGMLSSTSSLTRQQPVGVMSSFGTPTGGQQQFGQQQLGQQQQFGNRSQERLNRSRQNFFGSGELDQANKTNQYFGSGGNLNLSRTEMNFAGNTNLAPTANYNNKNLSTGSLHLAQQQQQDNRLISGQPKPKQTHSREQFRMGLGYQQDQYDQRLYSSHTNLNANQHSFINGPRRNSMMDPFRDHFDQYFTPKKQATTSSSNLKAPATAATYKASNLATTDTITSPTRSPIVSSTLSPSLSPTPGLSPPIMSNPLGSSLNTTMSSLSNTMNNMGNTLGNSINGLKTSMPGIAGGLATNDATPNTINNLQANSVNRKEFRNQTKDALLDPLDKLNENKDSLAEYQGLNPNRRLTLPELPRALETATSNEQIKGYAVSKPKGDALASAATRRKNSLPDNVKSAAAVIKPGWNREEVSVLAHEAREAKAKAAELTGTQVTVMKLKDWFLANLFIISLVVFNASIFYVYLKLMGPLDDS